jgi:hypothetical protein
MANSRLPRARRCSQFASRLGRGPPGRIPSTRMVRNANRQQDGARLGGMVCRRRAASTPRNPVECGLVASVAQAPARAAEPVLEHGLSDPLALMVASGAVETRADQLQTADCSRPRAMRYRHPAVRCSETVQP